MLTELPLGLRERLGGRGLEATLRVSFEEPPPARTELLNRSHPIVATLADYLLEASLDRKTGELPLGRAGAWPTSAVQVMTTVALLRLRFKLTVHGRKEQLLLVEEASAVAFGPSGTVVAEGEEARALLEEQAGGDIAPIARERVLTAAVQKTDAALSTSIVQFALRRAEVLATDHARVREAGINVSRVTVKPVIPADVIGLFVLLPAEN